ncbi:MAG: hypothetical protein HYZ75_09605, partial [Elusimicrobia bacterium]|nr:hypothetical protein [Elusimicrobiota bacterium]
KQALAHEVEDALVDAELDKKIRNGDKVTVDWDEAAGALTAKPEPKITNMGGFGLFGMGLAGVTLGGTQLGLALAGAVLIGIGVGYVVASVAYRYAMKKLRKKYRLPEPPKKFSGFNAGVIGGLFGAALGPWLWGMAPIHTAVPSVTLGALGLISLLAVYYTAKGALAMARWLARVVMRRGPPPPKAARRFSRWAKAGLVAAGLALGVTMGGVPYVASQPLQARLGAVVSPELKIHAMPQAFTDEVRLLMEANPVGRDVLEGLRDRGGVVRIPAMLMMVEDEGVGAHYQAMLDHVSIPFDSVKDHGWTMEEFMASPDKQRQLAREYRATLSHELRHAMQYRRSILSPGVILGRAIEFEWEAYLTDHDFVHAELLADPQADIGSEVWGYEAFLDSFDGRLKDIENSGIYKHDSRIDAPFFNDMIARRRADWPRHAAEGYLLLAQRSPARATYYLGKAAAAEAGIQN